MGKRWTEEEKQFLTANYKKMSYQKIGLILNKKITQVKQERETLGLCCKKIYSVRFDKKELDFIEKYYPRLSQKTISKKLNMKLSRVKSAIKKIQINTKKPLFKHDYFSSLSITKILNISRYFLDNLINSKYIKLAEIKTENRVNLKLIHIDEFEKIKNFLNNYIPVKDFIKHISYSDKTIFYRIKTGKIKDFLKVGSKYFIHKNEIEIQRSL